MPAEWAPHEATWVSWPHNRDTWPGCFEQAEAAFVEMVAALAESEPVHVNVLDDEHAAAVGGLLRNRVPAAGTVLHAIPTDDAWIRDHGALFVTRVIRAAGTAGTAGAPAAPGIPARIAIDFDYNAWGGKYPPYDRDQRVARAMAGAIGAPCVHVPIVAEGGSVDVDGSGLLLTTEQCLLNPNRNPSLTRAGIEAVLRDTLGIDGVIWLGGGIAGDDTDGHVDQLTRFVAAGAVVTAVEPRHDDANFEPLARNRERLEAYRHADGTGLTIVDLPMPDPLYYRGERLPASYANFYIGNECVLVPAFDCPADRAAAGILAHCFPSRRIVPIDCRALVVGLGAVHCLTQQLPSA